MEQMPNLFFIVYLLKQHGRSVEVRCRGCREIVIPDYKTPTYIRGMIEFEGDFVPVIDPGLFFRNQPAEVTNSTCILIVQHSDESRKRRTGVLIDDIEEIMNLAAGSYKAGALKPSTFNMGFILEIPDSAAARELLAETHTAYDLCEQQKQADADFAVFREIVSRSVDRVPFGVSRGSA
jgi:hypothetical protein